jgi:hypothetical protein
VSRGGAAGGDGGRLVLRTVALRWFFFQAMWRCIESCLVDVSFFFLCDFPLFSSTPLCFSVFLPFYSSFFFPSLSLFPLFIFLFVSLMF